jgi:hypothetical protein
MKKWNHSLVQLAVGVPGLVGILTALYLSGAEDWLLVLTLGAMIIAATTTTTIAPEARFVLLEQAQAPHPLGALSEVEVRRQQACRSRSHTVP